MKSKEENGFYLIVLSKGEEIVQSLTNFAADNKIGGGAVLGIGGVRDVTLGFFDTARKEYIKKNFDGFYEMASLTGSLSFIYSKPFCHLHAVISGVDMVSYSGHLFSATVGVTAEIFITPFPKTERRRDPGIGLNLISLP